MWTCLTTGIMAPDSGMCPFSALEPLGCHSDLTTSVMRKGKSSGVEIEDGTYPEEGSLAETSVETL